MAAVPKHPDFGFVRGLWSVSQRSRDACVDSEQRLDRRCPRQQSIDQATAAAENLSGNLDQALAERTEVHADDASLVGLTYLLCDGRAGLGDRQAQPAFQVPRQSGHDHVC